jgi:hydrogenase small subunit
MKMSRRNFLKIAAAIGASATLLKYKLDVLDVLREARAEGYQLVWLQGQGCTGCTISLIQYPDVLGALESLAVNIPFHPTIMPQAGVYVDGKVYPKTLTTDAMQILDDTIPDFTVVEGSIPAVMLDGLETHFCEVSGRSFRDLFVDVASRTKTGILAVGTCASFGGIPSGDPNPTYAEPVSDVLTEAGISTPLINLPGCPAHPDWIVLTLAHVIQYGLPALDEKNRPIDFYGETVHNKCERLQYYEKEKYDKEFPVDEKCLFLLGCKGLVAYADCPTRLWNNKTNWCVRLAP